MSTTTPVSGINPQPQTQLHTASTTSATSSTSTILPMQQLRPLTVGQQLPGHGQFQHIPAPPLNPQQLPQQQEGHISTFFTQNGGGTPVSATGPPTVFTTPTVSTPVAGFPTQAQTNAPAIGAVHHFQGIGPMPPNGVIPGTQGITTYPPPFKRKAIRAAQACDACRGRKAKCDEGRPSCGFCKETSIQCVYREVPPPKQDRTLLEILSRLGRIESLLDSQNAASSGDANSNAQKTEANVAAIVNAVNAVNATAAQQQQQHAPPNVATNHMNQPSPQSQHAPLANMARSSPRANSYPPNNGPTSNPTDGLIGEDDDHLTIPYQHTTAAHKLLWWPSIGGLIDDYYAGNDGYIMQVEEGRGCLRIWGRGENAGSGEMFDEGEDPEAAWGVGLDFIEGSWLDSNNNNQQQPYEADSSVFEEEDTTAGGTGAGRIPIGTGGLTPAGTLRLDPDTVMCFLNSYLANIHILHPILDKNTISRTTQEFLNRITPQAQLMASPQPSFAGVEHAPPPPPPTAPQPPLARRPSNVTGKRKRAISISNSNGAVNGSGVPNSNSSNNGTASHINGTAVPPRLHSRSSSTSGAPPHLQAQPSQQGAPGPAQQHQKIPKTIHSALVLLVMALGSICLHRKPVPGPLPPMHMPSPKNAYSPAFSQTGGSPGGAYHAHPPPHRIPKRLARNIDVIPGLAYFAKALEIMGILFGGNELENVQAGLLAGLYWGQLGRVLDSWKWISWACTGCQVLVKMRLPYEKVQVRNDLILRLFWSCLQLESDVLAELDLPPSGISRLEDSMLLPSGHSTEPQPGDLAQDDQPEMWMYYLAQIALRKLLNRVHTALYKQQIGRAPAETSRSLAIARELDFQLEQWKLALPPQLRWDEHDAPSADINAARLRAKYFGARYIIHRPFVYQVIHGLVPGGPQSPASASDMGAGSPADGGLAASFIIDSGLEQSCRKCIEAAVQSTTAFHAFLDAGSRPIITNVFGTAHAQFGNLLVLSAAFRSPFTRHMVHAGVLARLFRKTMVFLRQLAPISAALRQDLVLLEGVVARLGLELGGGGGEDTDMMVDDDVGTGGMGVQLTAGFEEYKGQ